MCNFRRIWQICQSFIKNKYVTRKTFIFILLTRNRTIPIIPTRIALEPNYQNKLSLYQTLSDIKKPNYQTKHSLYQTFRIMTAMLSRDGPFESNLKDAIDYCHTVENSNREIFTAPAEKSENLVEVETYFGNMAPFTLTDNVNENCSLLKNAIDQFAYTSNLNLHSGFHLQRIIFLGQIGSGRKPQARLLAKRWHLVFLDFRVLLLEHAKLNKSFDDFLMNVQNVHQLNRKLVASILFERITRRDCLENGWILVGYASSVTDLKVMEKQFHVIPNKIMFIHCRQNICLDRLRNRIIKKAEISELRYSDKDMKYAKLGFLDLFSPCYAINHIMAEMDHFCRKRREILKYCQEQAKYIAHVDGEHSVSTVTTLLSGQLERLNF